MSILSRFVQHVVRRGDDHQPLWQAGLVRFRSWRRSGAGPSLEWHLGGLSLRLGLEADSAEGTMSAYFAIPGISASLEIPFPELADAINRWAAATLPAKVSKHSPIDVIRLAVHDKALWWSLMHTSDEWHSVTPRWREGNIHPLDAILGPQVVERENISKHDAEVGFPEGTYKWHITLQRVTMGRARWPFRRSFGAYDAEALEGQEIPIPGKGDNVWDCGSDALYGQTGPGDGLSDAVSGILRSVMRTRMRHHGSVHYAPEAH